MKNKLERLQDFFQRLHQRFIRLIPKSIRRRYLISKKRHPNENNNRKNSAFILIGVMSCLAILVIGRLVYIEARQQINGVSLDKKTRELYQGHEEIIAKRGTIFDRNGNPIAEDATSYSVYGVLDKDYIGMNDQKLYVQSQYIDDIASILHEYLGLKKSFVEKQLSQSPSKVKQVEFGTKGSGISLETKNKIEKALKKKNIKGIYFNSHPDRIYPNGVFASHLIGYTTLENDKDESKGLQGVMGIEAAFNKELSGTNGEEYFQRDVNGNAIPGTVVVTKKAKDGDNIYTTLDSNLEIYLESLMTKVDKQYTPESMTAVLVQAKTGQILAASQRPTFNPETKEGLTSSSKEDTGAQWRNLLVQDAFEPGSVMKIFTVAAAIQTGCFNPNATYNAGSINVDGTVIRDWDYDKPKVLTYAQALSHSSNVGMIHLEQAMGNKWQVFLQKFGFTKSTNSGLPGEVDGSLQNSTSVDRAMTAYGQAVAVTNFQMIRAITAIANDGKMLKPQYIKKIVNPNTKKVTKTKTQVVGHPISKSTAEEVLQVMRQTVEDQTLGTGTAYALNGYQSSVKTGTAQIFENGAYSSASNESGDFLYSMVQIAPTEDPEYFIYVTMKRPHIPAQSEEKPTTVMASITTPLMERALSLNKNSSQYQKQTTATSTSGLSPQ